MLWRIKQTSHRRQQYVSLPYSSSSLANIEPLVATSPVVTRSGAQRAAIQETVEFGRILETRVFLDGEWSSSLDGEDTEPPRDVVVFKAFFGAGL